MNSLPNMASTAVPPPSTSAARDETEPTQTDNVLTASGSATPDHTPPVTSNKNNDNATTDNLLPTIPSTSMNKETVATTTTVTEKPAKASTEGKRLIRTIRPIDVRKLQQSGLDRKIAEALSKQKQTILNKSAGMGTKVMKSSKKLSSNTIASNNSKVIKPVSTPSSAATAAAPASIVLSKPLVSLKQSSLFPAVAGDSDASPSSVVAASKPMPLKSIIPPKITITGPETPSDSDRQEMCNLSPEQRMIHVKRLLHKKLLQRQISANEENKPKSCTHLQPPSLIEPEKPPSSNSKRNKKILQTVVNKPLLQTPSQTEARDTNDNPFMPVMAQNTINKSKSANVQEQSNEESQDMSYSKQSATVTCSGGDKQLHQTAPIIVRHSNQQSNQRIQETSYNKHWGSLYNIPGTSFTTTDKQCSQSPPVNVRGSYAQPTSQREQDASYSKLWGELYNIPMSSNSNVDKQFVQTPSANVRILNQQYNQRSQENSQVKSSGAFYIMPKGCVKPVDKQLLQSPTGSVTKSSDEVQEITPSNKLTTKSKTPQKSPQDIARKLDFQTDEQLPKVVQNLKPSNLSTLLVHDIIYNKAPKNLSVIPKASIKPVNTPQSPINHGNINKQRIVIPDVSPLKTPFPTANIPQEAPLPTIDTFKKPNPLPDSNYYHMFTQPKTIIGPHTGFITTNYHIHQSGSVANDTDSPQTSSDSEYNVTPVVTINTPMAPNLIVLENKVLSQDEMIDLTALRLSTSKVDAPQRFARPHKPIPEVVIKQEKPDDFPTNNSTIESPLPEQPVDNEKLTQIVNQNPAKSLVFISSNQNKKFIVNASKLKLPPEKIADLAKKIAERTANQALTTERKNIGAMEGGQLGISLQEQQQKAICSQTPVEEKDCPTLSENEYVSPENPALENVDAQTSENIEKTEQKQLKVFGNTPANTAKQGKPPPQFGQKFFLIVKKDAMISTKMMAKTKAANNAEDLSSMSTGPTVKPITPPKGIDKAIQKNVKKIASNVSAERSFKNSPIKNRKSAVEIIDEPQTEDSFSAVDFIASLSFCNPITEDTQLELSPEEMNLNASCTMNSSSSSYSPQKANISSAPNEQHPATASTSANQSYNEKSTEIVNAVKLCEDNNKQNISMPMKTTTIESSKGPEHMLRKSVESTIPLINIHSCKMKPIKIVNILDSSKLRLQKSKEEQEKIGNTEIIKHALFHANATTIETETIKESNHGIAAKGSTSNTEKEADAYSGARELEVNKTKPTKTLQENISAYGQDTENTCKGSQNLPIESDANSLEESMSANKTREQVKEALPNVKLQNAQPSVPGKDNTENIGTLSMELTCVKSPTKPMQQQTEHVQERKVPTKSQPSDTETSVASDISAKQNEDNSGDKSNSINSPVKSSSPQKCEKETTKSQSSLKNILDTESTTAPDNSNLKSILKTNPEHVERIAEDTMAIISDIPNPTLEPGITPKDEVEKPKEQVGGELPSRTSVTSKRISRFKKGKINLVQRNKPVVAATSASKVSTIPPSIADETTTSQQPHKTLSDNKIRTPPALDEESSEKTACKTIDNLQLSSTNIERAVSELDIDISEKVKATQTNSEEHKRGSQPADDNVHPPVPYAQNLVSKENDLAVPFPTETNVNLDVSVTEQIANNDNITDHSNEPTKQSENISTNTTNAAPIQAQSAKDSSTAAGLCNQQLLDRNTSLETSHKDISSLPKPPKMPKHKSNSKKSDEPSQRSPTPTAENIRHATISLVDIVKNPPSEIPATPPQIPFKRKSEETSKKTNEIVGIRNLLEKIKNDAAAKETESNEQIESYNNKVEEHKAPKIEKTEEPVKEIQDLPAHEKESTKCIKDQINDKSSKEIDLAIAPVEVEASENQNKSDDQPSLNSRESETSNDAHKITEDNENNRTETENSDHKESRRDFKSHNQIEKTSPNHHSVPVNSNESYSPSPISRRRSTRLGLDSGSGKKIRTPKSTDTSSDITGRCSTRSQTHETNLVNLKSSKKPRMSLSDHGENEKEESPTKNKENCINSKRSHNTSRTLDVKDSEQTLFDEMKNTKLDNSNITLRPLEELKTLCSLATPTKEARLSSEPSNNLDLEDVEVEKVIALSSTPPPPTEVVGGFYPNSTKNASISPTLNPRKKLRKTIEDIKKSHNLATDSEDDHDFDSMNGCADPTDFLGFEDNSLGSLKSQNPDCYHEDEKSLTNVATTKGGTLKNWLTTGKAISPTSSKEPMSKRLRHDRKSGGAMRGIPLKKRWDASKKSQEETDITDDTSPADDEDDDDGELLIHAKRSKRYSKTVIDNNKDLMKSKIKKKDAVNDSIIHKFAEPKPIESTKTKVSETDSDTTIGVVKPKPIEPRSKASETDSDTSTGVGKSKPIESRTKVSEIDSDTTIDVSKRLRRPRRRLISVDFEMEESSKKSAENADENSGECEEADAVMGILDSCDSIMKSDVPKSKSTPSKSKVSKEQDDKSAIVHLRPSDTTNEESYSAKSLKTRKLRNSLRKDDEDVDVPSIQDEETPKIKSKIITKSRCKRKLEIEKSDEEAQSNKSKRTSKRKQTTEESVQEEYKPDVNEAAQQTEKKKTNEKRSQIEDSNDRDLIKVVSTIPQSCVSETEEVRTPTATPQSSDKRKYKKNIVPSLENQFNPRLLLITKREQLETDEVLTDANPGSGPIQCGLCMKRTTQAKWTQHLAEHYGVGWKRGEEQVNIQYRPAVINAITVYLKDTGIHGLTCRMCAKHYRSGLGMLMHIETCGAKKQRIDCEYCHRNYSKLSYPMHLRTCATRTKQTILKQEDAAVENAEEVLSVTGRAKRSSTLKAESKLKQMGAELVKNMDESQEFNANDHIRYIAPLSEDIRNKWSHDIDKLGKAVCPKKACPYASDKINDLEDHIQKCKFFMKSGYYCTFCKRRCFETKKEAIEHINALHRSGKDFSASDSDCNIKTDDEQSSNDDDDDDLSEGVDEDAADVVSDEGERKHKSDSASAKKTAGKSKTTPNKSNALPQIMTRKKIFAKRRRNGLSKFVLRKWKCFLNSNYSSEPLFDTFKSQYSILDTTEYTKYLPNQKLSMKFSMAKDCKLLSKIGEPEANLEWNQIERYKPINHGSDAFVFLGAPVTCCSWLPLPDHVEEQYLLVAYRKDMFKFVKFINPKHYNTTLMLFKVTQSKKNINKSPKIELHYGVAIEEGPVYNVAFLPSGGYNLQDNRLGLVAVASVANSVKIYSLPIELTKNCGETNENIPLIKIVPSFLLNLDVQSQDAAEAGDHILMNPQCLQISWSEFSGHNHICASFSNGYIGIWDVTNDPQENLNRFEVKNAIHYAPLNYFYVGEKGIKHFALHYDTTGPRWLAVSCFYRRFVIYDIRNFMQPIPLKEDYAKNVMRCMDWCPLWEPVLIGYCDSIPNNGRCIQCVNPTNIMYQQQKLETMISAVTAVHYTPLSNMCVASVDNGDILFMDTREIHFEQVIGRKFGERRIISSLDIKRLDEKPIELLKSPDNTMEQQEWTMYEYDYKEKYGLVFQPLIVLKDSLKDVYASEQRRAPLNITPFMRVNTLRCNLNSNANNLVAMGYENGFIRVINFHKDSHFRNK